MKIVSITSCVIGTHFSNHDYQHRSRNNRDDHCSIQKVRKLNSSEVDSFTSETTFPSFSCNRSAELTPWNRTLGLDSSDFGLVGFDSPSRSAITTQSASISTI